MIYKVSERPVIIVIGQQGENDAENIQVDYSEWIEKYGSGIITAEYQRPDMSYPYPVTLTMADGIATWTVSETDVTWEDSGNGNCGKMTGFVQLVYKVGEIVKKTVIWPVQVNKSLGTSGPVPDPVQSWIDQMVELGAVVAENAAKAEQAAADAESYAEAAQSSANDADAAAEAAAASAEAAATAQTAAETAKAAAEAAQAAAEQARSEAEAAETGAEDAQLAAEAAKSGAEAAQAAAEAAAQSATAAQNAAEAARDAAQTAQTAAEAARDAAQQYAEEAAEAAVNALIPFLPVDSASGAIASFPDGANDIPVISLTAEIEPVQDLNGYANPWPAGGGKNLLDWDKVSVGGTHYGMTFSKGAAEGTVVISGTLTTTSGAVAPISYADNSLSGKGYVFLTEHISGDSVIELNRTYGFRTENEKAIAVYLSGNVGQSYTETIRVSVYAASQTSWTPYENVCPIFGHMGAQVEHTGKNLLQMKLYDGGTYNPPVGTVWTLTESASQFTNPAEGVYEWTPTASWQQRVLLAEVDQSLSYHLKLKYSSTGTAGRTIGYLDENYTVLTKDNTTDATSTFNSNLVIPSGAKYLYIVLTNRSNASVVITVTEPQLELGSTATDYEPYQGETITQEFVDGQGNTLTVYGGESEIVGGVLRVTRGERDMGSLRWDSASGGFYSTSLNTIIKKGSASGGYATAISSQYKTQSVASIAGLSDFGMSIDIGGNVQLKDSRYSTAAELKTGLNGVQICFELAEPIEYTLIPQEVRTLLGQNNLWSDTGNTEVTYRADIQKYIEKKVAS